MANKSCKSQDKLQLSVPITSEYINLVNKLGKNKQTAEYTFEFDVENYKGKHISVEFFDETFTIQCSNGEKKVSEQKTYKQIKMCCEISDGLILYFRDKRYFFIPVGNNDGYNTELICAVAALHLKCGDFRFKCHSRMAVPDLSPKNKAKKDIRITVLEPPILMIFVAILAVFLGFVFTSMRYLNAPILKSEAEVISKSFDRYELSHRRKDRNISIFFTDGEREEIRSCCIGDNLIKRLDALDKGMPITVLVNPNNDYIIEITSDNGEILNFNYAQRQLKNEGTGFFWLGIFIWAAAIYLAGTGIVILIRERKHKRR